MSEEAPQAFVQGCQQVLGMLYVSAQQDLQLTGTTPAMFIVARWSQDVVVLDSQTLSRSAASGVRGDDAVLTPQGLDLQRANEVFVDLAGCLCDGELAVRITHDVWLPLEGLTSDGESYVRRMTRQEQLRVPGATPLWVVEFLSPGPRWYARSTHQVLQGQIAPAPLFTAAVAAVVVGPAAANG